MRGWFRIGLAISATAIALPAMAQSVTAFDGTHYRLHDLKGQVVVLNFWATWCGPCKKELPLLDAYYRKLHERGIMIFAVATEDELRGIVLD